MTTATAQQDRLHGEDTVAQMAQLIDRFSRMLSIMPGADSSPLDTDDRADERALACSNLTNIKLVKLVWATVISSNST